MVDYILTDLRVILKSIDCVKQVINKLDHEQGGLNGVDTVISQFSINEVMTNPVTVLDALIVYLKLVHNIDWYSDKWSVVSFTDSDVMTVRPEPGLSVSSGAGRERSVEQYCRRLVHRTELFLQV